MSVKKSNLRRPRRRSEPAKPSKGKNSKRAATLQGGEHGSSTRDSAPTSIVGIGASAGGLEAFADFLTAIPPDTGLGFVLIQHLAPTHESILTELLAKRTRMRVVEARDGQTVQANCVYVIPPNAELTILQSVLHIGKGAAERSRRMPIDVFLRSLAEDQQSRAIGIILSGTASDGTLGLQAIKALGGVTFAQDDSARYSAMPRNAIASGYVDFVLPPNEIAKELKRIADHAHMFAPDDHLVEAAPAPADRTLGAIFGILKNVSRVDFSYYKTGTIRRRINRRMFLRKVDGIDAYLRVLRKHPEEVESLFNDLLINVTGFFRDPEAFEVLRKAALPNLAKNKGPGSPVRIWVPGCSTGEEAYSLAIVLLEFFGEAANSVPIQIFATDVSESVIQKARAGTYPESIAMDVPADRLRRFFQKVEAGYQINKTIRDMCVFAKQDIAKDPPFSRLDMISCRNVMIYMGPVLQKRIIPMFHYALNSSGILFLGSSETVGNFGELFTSIDKKYRIYSKKPVAAPLNVEFVPHFIPEDERRGPPDAVRPRTDLQKAVEHLLITKHAPACVVVNERMEIVQFIGQTGRFLDPAPGDASLNLLKMVKSGLQLELRLAFQGVKRLSAIRKEGLHVEHNGGLKIVNFEIVPLKNIQDKERFYLVVFEDAPQAKDSRPAVQAPLRSEKKSKRVKMSESELEEKRLADELEATRDYLQAIVEEQRTTNEELRSANEEIQSSNEELQSINEELETAKEELQSTNEELTTVNEELQNRNDELTHVNNDLSNLLSSVSIPIVMLGNDLRIRRFTPMAEKIMNLIPTDVGRPITDITPNLKFTDLKGTITRVIDKLETLELDVEGTDGKWYSMRTRPYRTLDNKIEGAVIVLLELPAGHRKHGRP